MEPMSVNTAVTPGFGGRVYYPTGDGFVVLHARASRRRRSRRSLHPSYNSVYGVPFALLDCPAK